MFFSLMQIIYFKKYLSTVSFVLILLSPPVILALDRGNEIVTFLLIVPGSYLIKRNSQIQLFGAILLCLAAFFKLWPLVLLISILFFLWNHLTIYSKLLIFMTIIYWLIYRDNALNMLESTQKGSPFGLSFGLIHYINGSISWTNLTLFLSVIFAICSILLIRFKLMDFIPLKNSLDRCLLNSLMLTYFTIWVMGDSYIYRLILVIPILVMLRKVIPQVKARNLLETLIIATMLTSKLTVTTIMTSFLAIVFAIILIHEAFALKRLRLIR